MAINTSKVIVGGLVAGLVQNIVGGLVDGVLLGKRMMDEMVAVAPQLKDVGMGPAIIASRVIFTFAIGILTVWIYAAIRPRFGPGMATATKAGLVTWTFGFIFYLDWLYAGLMTPATYAMVSAAQLVSCLLAAWAGGRVYTEPTQG